MTTDHEPTLFDMIEPTARHTDPVTSKRAAENARRRAPNQRERLLDAYARNGALLDSEAARIAGLYGTRSCWWKRCSELRQLGYTTEIGTRVDPETRSEGMVCEITELGRRALERT